MKHLKLIITNSTMPFPPLPTYPNDGDNSLSVEDYLSHDGRDYAQPFTGDDNFVVPLEGEGFAGNTTDLSDYWRTRLPLGIRFRPADEELVTYLQHQSIDNSSVLSQGIIMNVDVYAYEPHQLPSLAIDFGDGKMYFFTYVKKIGEKKTERMIRTKPGCHWKGTQAPKEVIASSSGETVGYKTPLAYYEGKKKTQWLMQEYKLPPYESAAPKEYELVLAVVYYHHRKRMRDED